LRLVFGEAAVARFAMFEEALRDMDAVLNFRAHAGLRLFQLFHRATQLPIPIIIATRSRVNTVPKKKTKQALIRHFNIVKQYYYFGEAFHYPSIYEYRKFGDGVSKPADAALID
jgi:hypothetical protein